MAAKKKRSRQVRLESGDYEPIERKVVKVIRYRDKKTGKFTKKKRGSKKLTFTYRTEKMGRFASGIVEPLDQIITKKISTADLNEWDGMIRDAMMSVNIFSTAMARNARMVDINLTGFDGPNRIIIKKSISIADITQRQYIGDLMTGKIIERLHTMGYRTDYPIEIVKKWSDKATRRYEAKSYQVLKDINITFRVRH